MKGKGARETRQNCENSSSDLGATLQASLSACFKEIPKSCSETASLYFTVCAASNNLAKLNPI